MEVTQRQWNQARAQARKVLRFGSIGVRDAEDAAQEAWLSFLRTGGDVSYMGRKLKFLYATWCRDKKRNPCVQSLDDVGFGLAAEGALESPAELLERIGSLGLTPVAESVFEGLARGLTRRQIAGRLDLTVATVNWIVARWRDHVAAGACHVGRSRRGDSCDSREHDGGVR